LQLIEYIKSLAKQPTQPAPPPARRAEAKKNR